MPRTSPTASSTTDPRRSASSASRPWSSSPRSRAPFFAGAAVSILPGPIRRADPAAVGTDHPGQVPHHRRVDGLQPRRRAGPVARARRGNRRPRPRRGRPRPPFDDLPTGPRTRGRRDPAGHRGLDGNARTAQISPAAALANLRGLITRVNVDDRSRFHSWLPIYHDMGLAFLLVATLGQADLWQAPTTAFAGNPFGWLQVARPRAGPR